MYAIWISLKKITRYKTKKDLEKAKARVGEPNIVLSDKDFFKLEQLFRSRFINAKKK